MAAAEPEQRPAQKPDRADQEEDVPELPQHSREAGGGDQSHPVVTLRRPAERRHCATLGEDGVLPRRTFFGAGIVTRRRLAVIWSSCAIRPPYTGSLEMVHRDWTQPCALLEE
jgi:hypothetical protein